MKKQITAVGYARTSSATNVGNDKDSKKRQLTAIQDFANANNMQIVSTFYDAAVKGTDDVLHRKQFAEMLQYCSANDIKTIIVEDVSRVARDLMVQLTAESYLKKIGIQLIPTTAPDYFLRNDPTSTLIRNVLSSLAAFEKSNLCTKLAVARARKKALTGRCEGRKPITMTSPDAVSYARKLASVRKRKPTLNKIALALAEAGFVNANGKIYTDKTVRTMIGK
jgi:DNA invertase Pin-like site-specific DNA recombinase